MEKDSLIDSIITLTDMDKNKKEWLWFNLGGIAFILDVIGLLVAFYWTILTR